MIGKPKIINLTEYAGDDRVVSNYDILQRIRNEPELPKKETTFFPTLQKKLDGFLPGELIVVSGVTKMGKTLFVKSLCYDFCCQNERVLFFEYEEAPRYFLRGFPLESELITFFMPNTMKDKDLNWLFDRALEAKAKYETGIIFIDHLHFLFDLTVMRNASLNIGNFVRRIKRFAVENDYIIFLVCHTTKLIVEKDDDLTHQALRDSGLVACESDSCLFIHRWITSDSITTQSRSILKVDICRRTGEMNQVIPIVKHEHFLRELQIGEIL